MNCQWKLFIIFRENLSFKSVENQVMAAVVNVKCESVKTVELSVKKEEISHVDIKTEPSDKEEDDLDLNHFEVERWNASRYDSKFFYMMNLF